MDEFVLSLRVPSNVLFGAGSANHIFSIDEETIVVASSYLKDTTIYGIQNIDPSHVFYKSAGEPDSDSVDFLAQKVRELGNVKHIVAVGGGSTIDTAKGLALLLGSGGKISDYEFGVGNIGSVVPFTAVPTTCGSGSEATPYCVINNSDTGRKFTLNDVRLLPEKVVIDPCLMSGLNDEVFLSGVFDAFIHSLEARLSLSGNVLINPLAEESLRWILQKLPEPGPDVQLTENLLEYAKSAFYAGVSIAHSRTGLIHTLSVAFARFIKEPHGLLNARLLPYVLRFNCDYYHGRLEQLMKTLQPQAEWNDHLAVEYLVEWFQKRLPSSHAVLHSQDDIVKLLADRVEQDSGLPKVNPRPLRRHDVEVLVAEILLNEFNYVE